MANKIQFDEDDDLTLEKTRQEAPAQNHRIKTGIGLFYPDGPNNPKYGTPLTGLKNCLLADVHEYLSYKQDNKMVNIASQICRKSQILGETECKWCKFPDKFDPANKVDPNAGKRNKAKPSIVIPFFMFDYVNQVDTWKGKDKDGKEVTYSSPSNPVKFVPLKRLNEDSNIQNLIDLDLEDSFVGEVFAIKKYDASLKKAMDCETIPRKMADKKFQHLGGCEVPAKVMEYWNNLDRKQIRGLAANCYGLFTPDAPATLLKYTTKPEPVESASEASLQDDNVDDLVASVDG